MPDLSIVGHSVTEESEEVCGTVGVHVPPHWADQ